MKNDLHRHCQVTYSLGTVILAFVLALAIVVSPVKAGPTKLYISNRPVTEYKIREGKYYILYNSLGQYFSPQQMKRITYDAAQQWIYVDGLMLAKPLAIEQQQYVPVAELAQALGLEKLANKQLDTVEYVRAVASIPHASSLSGSLPGDDNYYYSQNAAASYLEFHPLSSNATYSQQVSRVGQKLARQCKMSNFVWNFYVTAPQGLSDAGMFTTGPGHVVISERILALGLTDDELAGLLASLICQATSGILQNASYLNTKHDNAKAEISQLEEQRGQLEHLIQNLYEQRLAFPATYSIVSNGQVYYATDERYAAYTQQIEEAQERIKHLQQRLNELNKVRSEVVLRQDHLNQQFSQNTEDLEAMRLCQAAGYATTSLRDALLNLIRNPLTYSQADLPNTPLPPPDLTPAALEVRVKQLNSALIQYAPSPKSAP